MDLNKFSQRASSELYKTACPHQECDSSDAYSVYDDGHGYCYSCGAFDKQALVPQAKEDMDVEKANKEYRYHADRGIKQEIFSEYKVATAFKEGEPDTVAFPYKNGFKYRKLREKVFWSAGNITADLFGSHVFDPGSKESITITEGEYDALSIYQATGGRTAAVSVPSSVSARKAATTNYEYINSFERIILALDNDDKGRKARDQIATLFDPKKVYVVDFTRHKDANDYLQNNEAGKLYQAWEGAKKDVPTGIIHTFDEIREALKQHKENKICTYPFKFLEEALHGIHAGEFILFKGLEGIGKTEVLRAIEYHVLKNTEEKLGIIRLEETYGDTIRGVATYEMQAPAMMEEAGISEEQAFEAYQKAVGGRDDRLYIQSAFDTDDPDAVLGNIRFLATAGNCRVVILDHLSMLVTGLEDDDVRKKLDYIVTRLKKMCIMHNFALISVIHVNDNGQTRDSRYPPKIANSVIHLERDVKHPDPSSRKRTQFIVEKGRGQGCKTGPVGQCFYDDEVSYTLQELKPDVSNEELEAFS